MTKTRVKPRGSDDDICALIHLKRSHAKEAMKCIINRMAANPSTGPSVELLLLYLSNMTATLELMLKLLSSNWSSHDVAAMYEDVFAKPHPNPDFMSLLKVALTDQKYFFEPSSDPKQASGPTIADYIPEIEWTFDVLRDELVRSGRSHIVQSHFDLSARVGDFLEKYAGRFWTAEPVVLSHDEAACFFGSELQKQHEADFNQKLQATKDGLKRCLNRSGGKIEVRQGQSRSIEALT